MDPGYYAACTAMMAQDQSLELVANNLANNNTAGYKAQRSLFRSVLAATDGHLLTDINQATNDYGVLGGSRLDLSQGGMQTTGNDLDVAAEGSGYFVVQTVDGKFYTRNGAFHLAHGQLVTSEGDPVLGATGIIRIPNGKVSISSNGTISVDGAITGKLELVDFAPGTQLASAGKTYYTVPGNAKVIPAKCQVRQGTLESSNVDPIIGVVDLITVQRTTEMMQRALSLFDGQLNKTAVEELPRVG